MQTELRTIGPDGSIIFDPAWFYGWIVERFCANYVEDLTYECACSLAQKFLLGAYRLAQEVIGTGYDDWGEASTVFGDAGRAQGIDGAMVDLLLDKAWVLARAGFTHWTQLLRQWVSVGDNRQFFHIPTGVALTDLEFGVLFEGLAPTPDDPIVPFLYVEGAMEMVTAIERRPIAAPTFEGEPGNSVLCLPQVWPATH